jgi:hypothetical protein
MDRIPKRTRAEQETLFRFDEDEHVFWASTTTPRVATRWQRAHYPVRVLGRSSDGVPQCWEVKLAWTGRKQSWLRQEALREVAPAPHQRRGVARARSARARRERGPIVTPGNKCGAG